MKKYYYFAFILVFLVITLTNCKKTSNGLQNEEKQLLAQYLKSNHITTAPTADGLYYIPTTSGTGKKPSGKCCLEFKYTARLINNKVIGTSTSDTAALYNLLTIATYAEPYKQYYPYYLNYINGLYEGLGLMKEGGVAKLVIPSGLALGSSGTTGIPSYSTIIYDIALVKVDSLPYADDINVLSSYLSNLGLSYNSSNAVYFLNDSTTPGTGVPLNIYDSMMISYTGRLIDGRVFGSVDSLHHLTIKYGDTIGAYVGLQAAIKQMSIGEKATIVIPNYYIYYSAGITSNSSGQQMIPPFTSIVMDIKLLGEKN